MIVTCGAYHFWRCGKIEKNTSSPVEVAFKPARVLMQDFTGVPALVDLAAMRDAIKRLGGNPEQINPYVPVDLVIDHSVQVDKFNSPDALAYNLQKEFERNKERYWFDELWKNCWFFFGKLLTRNEFSDFCFWSGVKRLSLAWRSCLLVLELSIKWTWNIWAEWCSTPMVYCILIPLWELILTLLWSMVWECMYSSCRSYFVRSN